MKGLRAQEYEDNFHGVGGDYGYGRDIPYGRKRIEALCGGPGQTCLFDFVLEISGSHVHSQGLCVEMSGTFQGNMS
jgi:hypothetical protein